MRLDHLLSEIGLYVKHSSRVKILDLALDSRQVTDGSLFIAIQGSNGHGLDYLEEGRKLRKEIEKEKKHLVEIKDRKIHELRNSGVPGKYLTELMRHKVEF